MGKSKPSKKAPGGQMSITPGFRLTSAKLFSGIPRNSDKNYLNEPTIKLPLIVGITAFFLSALTLIIYFQRLPVEVPLHYSRPWGETRLSARYSLWFLPLVSILFTLINLFLGKLAYHSDSLLARILVWGGSGTAVIISLALVQIVRLVAS
jgi:hypothetical protein